MSKKNSEIKILLVEDEDMVQEILMDFLEDEGFDVDSVFSGEDGLKKIANNNYDVVIADMRLPVMDGNIFIKDAKKLKRSLSFIIYTGSISYHIPEDLLKLGIKKDYLFFKPLYDMSVISEAIFKCLEEKSEES